MFAHVARPHTSVAHLAIGFADQVNDSIRKSAGATGGVKNEDTRRTLALRLAVCIGKGARDGRRIGEAIGAIKLLAQEVVYGTHDIGDNGFGRVVDAAQLTEFGVVLCQEGFVEMHDGVFLARAFAEVCQHRIHIGHAQHLRQFVDEADEGFIFEIGSGNGGEQLA